MLTRRRHRSRQAADPDLLAGRAGAADHLAAGGDQGPGATRARTISISASTACRCWARTRPSCAGWSIAAARSITARWGKEQARAPARRAVLGADPGTILAAVTPVPDTCRNTSSPACCAASEVELVECKTAAAEGAGRGRDRARRPCLARRLSRRRPLWRPHRLLQFGRAVSRSSPSRAITMRRDPIYLSTFTGRPPDEPSVLGEALNEVFIPLLQPAVPRDRRFLAAAGRLHLSHRRGVDEEGLSRPRQAGDDGVWSYLRQFMYTKWVIVVDDDIDARDWKDVMWAISTRMDPARDITVIENTPIDYLDFASPGIRPGLQDRPGRHQQVAARDPARMGPARSRMDQDVDPTRSRRNGRGWACPAAASRSGNERGLKLRNTGKIAICHRRVNRAAKDLRRLHA